MLTLIDSVSTSVSWVTVGTFSKPHQKEDNCSFDSFCLFNTSSKNFGIENFGIYTFFKSLDN